MNTVQFLDFLKSDPAISRCIVDMQTIPEQKPIYSDFPENLDPRVVEAIRSAGVNQLYSHQAKAIASVLDGKDTIVVTPTASGKSLSYLVPIFQRKLENPLSRSLLFFPTKALAQDQNSILNAFNEKCGTDFKIFTFDGDTAPTARKRITEAGDFVLTNPDMLHAGILPHHTNWIKLFENLEFIVIDEIHIYRGIFGSHVANLLRRLLRLAKFYGSNPVFIAASATVANPKEHAESLTERTFHLIDESGAPRGARHVVVYNPPVVNKSLGIRASALKETARLGAFLLGNKISTIFFSRSRLRVELLYTYLKDRLPTIGDKLRAYRGGYLPGERRKIEKELRDGKVIGVVSTNALELGVDIGSLDVSVTMGYPGSVSSLMQQFGRAGRRNKDSISILVATSDGTDQFLASHPEYFFESNPEQVMQNPDNLLILTDHVKCAAFELPFRKGETFGKFEATDEILEHLAEHGVLNRKGDRYFWMSDSYPANSFGLRSGPRQNFAVIDVTETGKEEVIGEVDLFSAPTLIHTDAIYLHQGVQYYVEELLWDELQARVKRMNVDYYTDAHEKVDLAILELEDEKNRNWFQLSRGELLLRIKAVMFKKIKLETHENLGWGDVNTPEIEMHTQGSWILLPEDHPIRRDRDDRELGAVLAGAAYALGVVSPVFVLCDPRDMKFRSEVKSPAFESPALYFYDSFPGGIGLSWRVMENISIIAGSAAENIERCECESGCPGCVGLPDEEFAVKEGARMVLESLSKI